MSLQEQTRNSWQWEFHTRKQKADDIDAMVANLIDTAAALEREIRQAEADSGISDVRNMAYSTSAQAFRARLRNIRDTLKLLTREQVAAHDALRPATGGFDATKAVELGSAAPGHGNR